MKLKLEINIQDIIEEMFDGATSDGEGYIDADTDLNTHIKNEIIYQVKRDVLKDIKEPISNDITERVKLLVKDSYAKEVDKKVSDFIEKGKVKINSYSKEEVSVKKWIQDNFTNNFNDGNLSTYVKNECENISKEIKDRYDLLFASSLVSKLNDQGLLKEGVFKAIMSSDNKS